jgi:hypothetical protein
MADSHSHRPFTGAEFFALMPDAARGSLDRHATYIVAATAARRRLTIVASYGPRAQPERRSLFGATAGK